MARQLSWYRTRYSTVLMMYPRIDNSNSNSRERRVYYHSYRLFVAPRRHAVLIAISSSMIICRTCIVHVVIILVGKDGHRHDNKLNKKIDIIQHHNHRHINRLLSIHCTVRTNPIIYNNQKQQKEEKERGNMFLPFTLFNHTV